MRLLVIITIGLLSFNQSLNAQVAGCMDPAASNYNPSATVSNGNCDYPNASTSLSAKGGLGSTLDEISGMTLIGGKLYAHNDGGNGIRNVIYEIDTTTRAITKTITLGGTSSNVDWEDITNDGTYIYVGDFGNNSDGARTDLKFYRFPIAAINAIAGSSGSIDAGDIDIINFTYEDQPQPPTPTGNNSTAFDCEAVIYDNGYLYLFTKNWAGLFSGMTTSLYRIPAIPGNHTAQKMDSFNTGTVFTGGILITSATKANDNVVLLLGYSTDCVVYVFSGFTDMDHLFQTGNKKRISLGAPNTNGQVEAIVAANQTWALLSNETYNSVSPTLYSLNLQPFTPQYVLPLDLEDFTARYNENTVYLKWQFETPASVREFVVEASDKPDGNFNVVGKLIASGNQQEYEFVQQNAEIAGTRYYRIKIVSLDGSIEYSKILPLKNDGGLLFNLKASPVPFNDRIAVSFYSDTPQLVQLNLVDMLGRTVSSNKMQVVKGNYTLSLDGLFNLTKGVYFLNAVTPRQSFVRKILKQ